MKVRAAVCYESGKPLVVEELELDRGPEDGEVLVRWAASGVCRSDLHAMNGYFGFPLPFIPGHEGAGVVQDVGPGVNRVKAGDHVVSILLGSCPTCRFCISGQPTLCERERVLPDASSPFRKGEERVGRFGPHQIAAFAEYCVVPERNLLTIRQDAPLDVACLLGCGAFSGAGPVFNRAKVGFGSRVVVFGCGGLGLARINAAHVSGALQIIAVDIVPEKLQWAKRFGATDVIDASDEDPVERVGDLTGGALADFAFEYVGLETTMQQAIESVRPDGMVVIMGVAKPGTTLTFNPELLLSHRVVTGSSVGAGVAERDVPMLVDMYMAGKFITGELVSHRLGLDEVSEAFDLMRSGESIRSVIVF